MIPTATERARLELGDALEVLGRLPDDSIDALVTDPPYGLEFMGQDWDKFKVVDPVLRAGWTKPAAHHSLPMPEDEADTPHDRFPAYHRRRRTYRCKGCGKRDSFRNAHACGDRWTTEWTDPLPAEALGFGEFSRVWALAVFRVLKPGGYAAVFGGTRTFHRMTCGIEDAGFEIRDCLLWMYGSGFPKSLDVSKAIDRSAGQLNGEPAMPEAKRWQGWGTALKPAWEPIILARKPPIGTIAENLEAHGVGALNIDGCRIETEDVIEPVFGGRKGPRHGGKYGNSDDYVSNVSELGRFPANVLLDPEAARILDQHSGEVGGTFAIRRNLPIEGGEPGRIPFTDGARRGPDFGYRDLGGASRFFYCAKASTDERDACGLVDNDHPTVKPVDLMRWVCRLVAPRGAVILDPFAGSGSTGVAALAERQRFLGIEREERYARIARRRLELGEAQGELFGTEV